ncbi:MAG TPA: ABC transporter permease [Candidatus Angelobacter sp.]|nr:ABC transporter permease [Candidatus Angelobacter sp.]
MDGLSDQVRYALRSLARTPGFTLIAVATLALGIGVNTAVFSVANAVLFRSLPFHEPRRIMMIWETYVRLKTGGDKVPVAASSFLDWQQQNKTFENMAAFTTFSFSLTGTGAPAKLDGVQATTDFFSVLGIKAAKGRTFATDEDQPGKNRVAVISDGLWHTQFGGDPNVLGTTVTLTGEKYEVIGIMPPGFDFPEGATMPPTLDFAHRTQLWTPLTFTPEVRKDRFTFTLAVIGRLKPSVTVSQAQAEMGTIAANIDRTYRSGRGFGVRVMELRDQVVGGVRLALLVLFGAVALVLLIACSNVANLLLVRFSLRQKDIALRTALGSSRAALIWQMLMESILLAIGGCGFGLILADLGIRLLRNLNSDFPRSGEISLNAWVFAFAFLIAVVTGVISGIIPALDASRTDPNTVLKEESRSASTSARNRNARNVLIVSEFSLTLVLLISAGLLIRSFMLLQQTKLGFNAENLLTMRFALPEYKYGKPEQQAAFVRQLVPQVATAPGVESAAVAINLPLSGTGTGVTFEVVGRPARSPQDRPMADFAIATPGYFKTMEIPLLQGRFFTDRDIAGSHPVIIINQAMARAYFPNENPIGKLITQGLDQTRTEREVIGVVGDVRQSSLSEEPLPGLFVPVDQLPYNLLFLIVRTKSEPSSMTSVVLNSLQKVDHDQPVYEIRSMEQVVRDSNTQRSFNMFLLTSFAGLALVLAMVGVYGVIVFSVSQRQQEIGIRMALGAQPGDIRKLILKQGLIVTGVGLAIGLSVAFGITHVLASLLYHISATDPVVFCGASGVLTVLALLATYAPAHRAAKLEPMVVLRQK